MTVHEDLKLVPSDPTFLGLLDETVALSGDLALVDFGTGAHVYQNLNNARGTVTENATILAYGQQGLSLSGVSGLIGTLYYRHLDQVSGTPSPDVVLGVTPNEQPTFYCSAVSLAGSSALVGSELYGKAASAFYYRDLSSATGTVTQDLKLIAPQAGGRFGEAVCLSGNRAVIGAPEMAMGSDRNRGAAYYFHNLDTAAGVVTAQVHLQASPANVNRNNLYFGAAVSLSGDDALIGHDSAGNVAYLYRHLDQASGTIYEDVAIRTSMATIGGFNSFGFSVSIDGDKFAIGDDGEINGGVVYTGSVSALTTNDFGNSRKVAAYVSFISHLDWVAGETTDGNQIALTAGDTATVKDIGKAVYIGKNAGADNNLLDIAGSLQCSYAYIGSTAGNGGNTLQVESTGKITATALRLAKGNRLLIQGTPAAAKTFLQNAPLQVFVGNAWKSVTTANYKKLVGVSQSGGYTVIVPL